MNDWLIDETIVPLTAADVKEHWQREQERVRGEIPGLTDEQLLQVCKKIYIFNVSPFCFEADLGQTGRFSIDPCPKGRDYSDPCILPGAFAQFIKHPGFGKDPL